jgi:hypothetical protein
VRELISDQRNPDKHKKEMLSSKLDIYILLSPNVVVHQRSDILFDFQLAQMILF